MSSETKSSWHQIAIPNNDVAAKSAQALMQGFAAAWRTAGCPDEAEVFHPRNEDMDHVYYFSPASSAITPGKLFQEFKATTCEPTKNLASQPFKVTL